MFTPISSLFIRKWADPVQHKIFEFDHKKSTKLMILRNFEKKGSLNGFIS